MSDPSPTRLPATLDLNAAEGLRGALLALPGDRPLHIDGSAVEAVATPALQVLAAAARSAGFQLVEPSPALVAAIADLGLAAAIPGAY